MGSPRRRGSSFEEAVKSIRQKKFSPVYLLHGEEDFLIDGAVSLLINEALQENERSFNLEVFHGGAAEARDILSAASSYPMMSERRVVIVRDFDSVSNRELLIPYIENPLLSTVFVLISVRPDFRIKIFKTLEQKAQVVEFRRLYESEIPPWIALRIGEMGKQATAEACQLLPSYVGRSLREIQNEIDKLFIYVGDKRTIGTDEVNAVVGMSKQYNVFELQRAVGQKNITRSLEISERMLESGESPLGMLVMLTRYFQKLWLLKDYPKGAPAGAEIASALGVSAFFAREYIEAARLYSASQIEKCFSALSRTDEAFKYSNPDKKLAMTLLLHSIIRSEYPL